MLKFFFTDLDIISNNICTLLQNSDENICCMCVLKTPTRLSAYKLFISNCKYVLLFQMILVFVMKPFSIYLLHNALNNICLSGYLSKSC